ncbi:MAG: hypothetical protein QW689_07820 [Nitrososphaerota archaeon]
MPSPEGGREHVELPHHVLRQHPSYYKIDGKALVFVWAAWSHEVDEWRSVFENLRRKGVDVFYVATASNIKYLEVFDGCRITRQ